jgi:hypothetical protein
MMPMGNALLQRKCACGGSSGPTGECEECRKKKDSGILQMKGLWPSASVLQVSEAPPIVHDILRTSGQPLDSGLRASMEQRFAHSIGRSGSDLEAEAEQMESLRLADSSRRLSGEEPPIFGHDFSRVRIHVGDRPAQSARAVNALAYTVGQHVVFGSGMYSPHSDSGRGLLAHELTHFIQQTTPNPVNTGALQRQEAPPDISRGDIETSGGGTQSGSQNPWIPIPVFDELDPSISVPDIPGIPSALRGQTGKLSDVKKALELLHPPKKGDNDCGSPFIGFEKATSGELKGLCCRGPMRTRANCCHWKQIAVFDNRCCTGLNIIVDGRCVPVRPASPAPFPKAAPAPRSEPGDFPERTLPPGTALA